MYVHMLHIHIKPGVQYQCSSASFYPTFWGRVSHWTQNKLFNEADWREAESLTGPRAHYSMRLTDVRQSLSLDPGYIIQWGWLTTELVKSSCLHSHQNYDYRPVPHAYFCLGAGDPNIGLLVCLANTLWTRLFSHPWRFCSLVKNVEGTLSRVWSYDLPHGTMTNFCLAWFLGGKMETNLLPFPAPSSQVLPSLTGILKYIKF